MSELALVKQILFLIQRACLQLNLCVRLLLLIALGIGNISAATQAKDLESLFSRFGKIESSRVLSHKNCGFINFYRKEDASAAFSTMNGALIDGNNIKINFAKVPSSASPVPAENKSKSVRALEAGYSNRSLNAATGSQLPRASTSLVGASANFANAHISKSSMFGVTATPPRSRYNSLESNAMLPVSASSPRTPTSIASVPNSPPVTPSAAGSMQGQSLSEYISSLKENSGNSPCM